jgi:hypothetical protein
VEKIVFYKEGEEFEGWVTRDMVERDVDSWVEGMLAGKVPTLVINVQRRGCLVGPFAALAYAEIHQI